MKDWLSKNYRTIIISAFLIPIIIVAIVSISHVTTWYATSNPQNWALYLSIGVEVAALSALAAIAVKMGRYAYFPFIIVTLIQFIGNIFFSYDFIDVTSKLFKSWVELTSPIMQFMGIESTDLIGHKRFLSILTSGLLPIISLTFLYMLVRFTERDEKNKLKEQEIVDDNDKNKILELEKRIDELTTIDKNHGVAGHNDFPGSIGEPTTPTTVTETITPTITASDIIGEISRVRLKEDELEKIEKIISRIKPYPEFEHPEVDDIDETENTEYPPITDDDDDTSYGETPYHDEIPIDDIEDLIKSNDPFLNDESFLDDEDLSDVDDSINIEDTSMDMDEPKEMIDENIEVDEVKKKFNRIPGGNLGILSSTNLA